MKKTVGLKKRAEQRILSALLAVVMMFGMLPAALFEAQAADWMEEYIQKVVDWGVMRGDVSGNLNAGKTITRAEFVTMVNRAFGYTGSTEHPFTDVRTRDWFNNDIGIAYNMGYFKGTSATTASPNSPLTREQAVVLIGRNLLLDEKKGEALGFSDSRAFSEWSRGMVESAIGAGFAGGYDDGSFKPQKNVTRGEVAAMLVKAIGTMVNTGGTHSLGGVYGNVMISTSGVKLKNTTIAGNLYITGGLELGDVMLENVNVLGKIIVSGAGESHKGDSSIVLRNVETGELVVDSLMDQFVTLRAEGNTQIDFTNVKTSAFMDDQTEEGDGLLYIEMNGANGMTLTLAGNIEEVLNRTPESILTMAEGTAKIVTVDEKAVDSTLDIKNIGTIKELNLDVGTPVTGEGDVEDIFINAAGSVVDMLPDKITIRPGLTADINGVEMDTKEGNESSSEPRILASYPKIKNIAPNSAEAVFSTNKKGTIYWALTSLIDGPVSVEDLLETKDFNNKILQQGTIDVTASEQEFKVKISKLISDGSYYVSAVLVDSRDQKSPVKYVTFTTPDGTAPGFASGYPELTLITKDNAQVSVMPTKTSKLYYAVLPKGATAPTISEFKTDAVTGDLGNCPTGGIPVTKNIITLKDLTDKVYGKDAAGNQIILKDGKLEELKSYDLYLCLIDPDNGKDSGVKKLSFTTVDGTPPILEDAMLSGIQKNAVSLTTAMNEAGTIYWAIVPLHHEYLPDGVLPNEKFDPTGNDPNAMKKAILQVVNGMGGVIKTGKVSAKASTDVTLKISGLQPATAYDVYYLAQDKAGNYSEVIKMISVNTLDDSAPTVRQEFTMVVDAEGKQPMPETDVKLIFSEGVRHADGLSTFWELYTAVANAATSQDEIDAKKALAAELKKAIQLWDVTNNSATFEIEHDPNASGSGSWINFENVTMQTNEANELELLFKNGEAINLGSGSTYHFVISDVTDVSDTKNPMRPNPYEGLDPFTTVPAQVILSSRASGNVSVEGLPYLHDGVAGTEADVDMRFWMDPQSTDGVSGYVYYDMWFETTGTIVAFDIYCRVIDTTATNAADKIVKTAGDISMFGTKVSSTGVPSSIAPDGNGWLYLGEMKISASDGTGRASVHALLDQGGFTNVPQLNSLNDDYVYEFVIDVVQVGTSTDEDSWSSEIILNVHVPAGQDLTNSDWGKTNFWQTNTSDVQPIGTPRDFRVARKFIDIKTPQFFRGYPLFKAGDSAVNMQITLDRAGTLYYVVAPVVDDGSGGHTIAVPTTMLDASGNVLSFDSWFVKDSFPQLNGTGVSAAKPFGPAADDASGNVKYKLEVPTNDGVALMVDRGVADVTIKTGKQYIQDTGKTVKVDGLAPETTYIAYFVLKGESQDLSPVYLFQFTTEKMTIPKIGLNVTGNIVSAKTSTDAELSWAVYAYDTANKISVFKKYMYDCVDASMQTAFLTDCVSNLRIAADNAAAQKITVLEAMQISMSGTDNTSLFDKYANDNIRKDIVEYVQGESSDITNKPTDMETEPTFTANRNYNIAPDDLSPETMYYFVAVARNTLGTEYGFKAIGGLRMPDAEAPELESYSTTPHEFAAIVMPNGLGGYNKSIYTDPDVATNPKAYAYKGEIRIGFSEPIYQKVIDSLTGVPTVTPPDENNFSHTGRVNVTDAYLEGTTLVIKFEDATEGNTITIFENGVISDAESNSKDEHKRLVLTFTSVTQAGNVGGKPLYVVDPHFTVKWDDTGK